MGRPGGGAIPPIGRPAGRAPVGELRVGCMGRRSPGRSGRRAGAQPPRITETAWFRHEHDEVPEAAWKRPAIGSAANCAACHRAAAQGDYRERNIRIPR